MENETKEKKGLNKESILGDMFKNIGNADILGGKSMFDDEEEEKKKETEEVSF